MWLLGKSRLSHLLDGHVGTQVGAVIDIGCLTIRRISARHVVVVTSEHNGCGNLTSCNSIIKSLRNLGAPLAVGIQDSRLRTHNKLVFFQLSLSNAGYPQAALLYHQEHL